MKQNSNLTAWIFICSVCEYEFKRVSDKDTQPLNTDCANCGSMGTMEAQVFDDREYIYTGPKKASVWPWVLFIASAIAAAALINWWALT